MFTHSGEKEHDADPDNDMRRIELRLLRLSDRMLMSWQTESELHAVTATAVDETCN